MARIFSSLAILNTISLIVTFWLGWRIEDAGSPAGAGGVALHLLVGVGAICFGVLVHALAVTYLMGTGRWLEETCAAYKLGPEWQQKSRDLKWGLYPAMVLGILLLIGAGAAGGAADPASALGFRGWGPLSAAQVHLTTAIVAVGLNAAVNAIEFRKLARNGALVNDVLNQVRRIRLEKGLAV